MAEEGRILTVCFGKQTFTHSTSTLRCTGWSMPTKVNPNGDDNLTYHNAMSVQSMLTRAGSDKVMAGPSAHNGYWYYYRLLAEASTSILIQLNVSKRVDSVESANSTVLFLSAITGPAVKVMIDCVPDVKATNSRITGLYGRGYVVTPQQAQQLWGLDIPRSRLINNFDQEEVAEDFIIETVGRGGDYTLPVERDLLGGSDTVTAIVGHGRPRRKLSKR